MKSTLLHEITWTEAKKYCIQNDLVLLPVGSTEQHGPQNPLGTDHLIARAIAEKASKITNVLCLPVIPFGISSHHRQFWGTIFIPSRVFSEYVKHVCLALQHYGIKKVIIVNGHGGNTYALLDTAKELRKHGIFVTVFIWWKTAEMLLPNLFTMEERKHASAEETSMNLALHSHLVTLEKAPDVDTKEMSSFLKSMIKEVRGNALALPFDFADITKSGVSGKSSTASSDAGKKVLETAVSALVMHIEQLKKFDIEELKPRHRM